jgi:phage gpG-like protein
VFRASRLWCSRLTSPTHPTNATPELMIELTAEIEFTGFTEAWKEIQALEIQRISQELRRRVQEQFLTEGQAYGQHWLERKRETRGSKNRPILFQTGRLRQSFLEGPEHIEEAEGTALTFGSRVPYAIFHQLGTRRMPARPILTPELLSNL